MLVLSMVFAACKDNKGKSNDESANDEEDTELVDEDEDEGVDEDSFDDIADVMTAREFILALKSNTRIRIFNNDALNITQALDELIDEGRIDRYMVNGSPQSRAGIYWEPEYDGNNLIIVKLHDILIEGLTDDGGFLMTTPRYSDVLHLEKCKNITVENLTLGHEETGECVGDVVVLNGCEDVTIDKCHLFGCGVNGLSTNHSSDISVKDTEIYGCSFFGVVMQGTEDVRFEKSKVFNNGCGLNIDEYCDDVTFDNCELTNNRGQLFMCYSKITVKNSKIEHHHGDFTENVKLVNCDVVMDYDEAEELPDIEDIGE